MGVKVIFVFIGNVIAWLGLIFGSFRFGMGVFIAAQNDPAERAALSARYLINASSGQAIDQAVPVIFASVALGILVKIAGTLRRLQYLAETD